MRDPVDFGPNLWLSCNKSALGTRDWAQGEKEAVISATDQEAREREHGAAFMPKFDSSGLLTAVVTDFESGDVLMVAFMDEAALEATRETGLAHFHSRSRGKLWMKGETSGHVLKVREILVDCDQDALVVKAEPQGPTCHTGAQSCFYRKLEGDELTSVES